MASIIGRTVDEACTKEHYREYGKSIKHQFKITRYKYKRYFEYHLHHLMK